MASWEPLRRDPRLFSLVVAWLAEHGDLVDQRQLRRQLTKAPTTVRAVAGLVLSLASSASPRGLRFPSALRACTALPTPRPLFLRAESNRRLRQALVHDHDGVARDWGWWANGRDLAAKLDAVASRNWLLRHVEELRLRALLGPGLPARIVARAGGTPASIRSLSKELHATYAGTHRAVERLVRNGWIDAPLKDDVRLVGRAQAAAFLLPLTLPD